MKIEFRLPSGQEIKHEIKKTSFVIGRSPHCDVVVPFDGFSRKHCQIDVSEDGDVIITDLDSANGVLIDGQKIGPNERTAYNLLFPLVIGPAEVTLEIDAPNTQHFQNVAALSKTVGTSTTHESSSIPKAEVKKIKKSAPASKKFDMKSIGAIALVVIAFFVYKEIKAFMSGESSEENELSRIQFESQLRKRGNDGSVKTRDF